MAMSPERKTRINPDVDPALRQTTDDPIAPDVYVRNTTPVSERRGSTAGFFIAAALVLLGFIFAIYFGSRSDTTAPVTQENTTIVPEATAPAPDATAPATPPATTETAPAQPDTTGSATDTTGTGTGTTGTGTETTTP